jgi:hypothetical protein
MHEPRDYKNSIFVKTLRVTQEDYDFIERIRGQKSKAGKLRELFILYREIKKLK